MARGFLSGILTGGFVSVLGLGTVSLLSEQPAGNTPPDAPQVEAPEVATATPPEASAPALTGPGEGDGPSLGPAPDVDAPDAITSSEEAMPLADTALPEMPEAGLVEGALDAPETGEEIALSVDEDAPVLPSPQASAPQTPAPEADIVLSTDPATPPAPVIVEETAEEAPAPDAEEMDEATEADVPTGPVVVEIVEPPEDGAEPDAETAMEEDASAEPEDPQLAEQPEDGDAAPTFALQGEENSLMADRDTGVTIRRPGSATEEPAAEAAPSMGPALQAYAAEAFNPENLPLMSILLLDDGSMSASLAVLAGLSFPVTIVLDPSAPGAADRLQAYRAEGYEVAVLARLPEGATPSDVEVTFGSVFAEFNETVAVVDLGDGGFQSNRDATAQAMDILASDGRGFVSVAQGLNMAGRAAEQADVPATTVYRDLDGEGQDARVIRRFVDQAAFRARQESGVVLVGRLRPDTVTALINWGNDKRANQVALVPVSAVLLAQ